MKTAILNLLIVTAVILNIVYGWRLGVLYGPAERNESVSIASTESVNDYELRTGSLPVTQQEHLHNETAVLERKIVEVVEQIQRMNLPEDTVLIIRPEGAKLCSGPAKTAMISAK